MKKLELKQMEEIQGGGSALTCDDRQTKIMAVAGMAATLIALIVKIEKIFSYDTKKKYFSIM